MKDTIQELLHFLSKNGFAIEDHDKDEQQLVREIFAALQKLVEAKGQEAIPEKITALLRDIMPRPAAPVAPDNRMEVRGQITGSDGQAQAGLIVRVYDIFLRGEKSLLGEAQTDETGVYSVKYSKEQWVRPAKDKPNISVIVWDAEGKKKISESPIRYQANLLEIIDFMSEQKKPVSVLRKLRSALEPLLEDLKIIDLKGDDIAFLAGSSRADEAALRRLTLSHKLAAEAAETGFEVHPDLFFGLLHRDMPDTLEVLATKTKEEIETGLHEAVKDQVIDPVGKSATGTLFNALRHQHILKLLKPSETENDWSLGNYLATLPKALTDTTTLRIGSHLLDGGHLHNPAFWEKLTKDDQIDTDAIKSLRLSLDLAPIVRNNTELIKAVHESGRVVELPDLAEWTEQDWLMKVKANCHHDDKQNPEDRTREISDTIERRFPSRSLKSKIIRPDMFISLNGMNHDLATFFKQNESFDFISKDNPARKCLDNGMDFTGVKKDNQEMLKTALIRLDRLARITPVSRHLEAMIEADYHSGVHIVSEGPVAFVNKLPQSTLDQKEVLTLYETIKARVAGLHNFILDKLPFYDNYLPNIFKKERSDADANTDWSTMFGLENNCDCDDCKSLISPSAYLADCLNFLKNQQVVNPITHFNILMQRRPDIPQTALTCDNTNVQLPYIDLINEVLEEAVATSAFIVKLDTAGTKSFIDFTTEYSKYLNGKASNQTDYKKAKRAFLRKVRPELIARGFPLGDSVGVSLNFAITTYLKYLKQLRIGAIKGGKAGINFHIPQMAESGFEFFEKSWSYSIVLLGNIDGNHIPLDAFTPEDYDLLALLNSKQFPREIVDAEESPVDRMPQYSGSGSEKGWTAVRGPLTGVEEQPTKPLTMLVLPWPQTGEKTPYLKAHPEHLNYRAYAKLEKAVYPLSLPFSLISTELSAYLKAMEVSNFDLIQYFGKGKTTERLMMMETLHLSDVDWKIITRSLEKIVEPQPLSKRAYHPWEYWGFDQEKQNKVIDPYDSTLEIPGSWDELLGFVTVLLKRASLFYVQLLELLDTYYINPKIGDGRRIGIVAIESEIIQKNGHIAVDKLEDKAAKIINGDMFCDLRNLRLLGIYKDKGAALTQLLRFLRLANKLAWPYRELDMFCTAYGIQSQAISGGSQLNDFSGPAGDKFLTALGYFQRSKLKLDGHTENMLTFYRNINTVHYVDYSGSKPGKFLSLYDSLFFNKAVGARPKSLTKPNGTLNEALIIEEQLPLLASAFETTTSDLQALLTALDAELEKDVNGLVIFHLDNLSHLYRYALLAGGLGLKAQEVLALIRITGIRPLPIRTEAIDSQVNTVGIYAVRTWQFLEAANRIRESGFAILELEYLLCGQPGDKAPFFPPKEEVALVLEDIRTNLQKIALDNRLPDNLAKDPASGLQTLIDLVVSKLPLLGWENDLITAIIGALKDEEKSTVDYALPNGLVFNLPANRLDLSVQNIAGFPSALLNQAPYDKIDALVVETAPGPPATATVFLLRTLTPSEYATLTGLLQHPGIDAQDKKNLGILLALHSSDYALRYKEDATGSRKLVFAGVMDGSVNSVKSKLEGIFYQAPAPANNEIEQLFIASRRSLLRIFRSNRPETFEQKFTEEVVVPQALSQKFYTVKNTPAQAPAFWQGFSVGALLPTQLELLHAANKNSPNVPAELDALDAQMAHPAAWPDEENRLFTETEFNRNVLDVSVPTRFQNIAERLLPYLRKVLSEQYAIQKCSDQLGLAAVQTSYLLRDHLTLKPKSALQPVSAIDLLTKDELFVNSHAAVKISETLFGDQFTIYYKLHKAALITLRLKLSPVLLKWMKPGNAGAGTWIAFDALLPVSPNTVYYGKWLNTVELAYCRENIPEGDFFFDKIFGLSEPGQPQPKAAASTDKILDLLSEFLQTPRKSVEALCKHFLHGNASMPLQTFNNHKVIFHLLKYLDLFKRSGGSLNNCIDWANLEMTKKERDEALFSYYLNNLNSNALGTTVEKHSQVQRAANSIKQAFRSLYSEKDWLELAPQVRNGIREKQRDALNAYLLQYYRYPGLYELIQMGANNNFDNAFKDMNDLYGWFLIDIEMGSCMMTTRVKQAISSTQLYIQRVLLQLEKIPDDNRFDSIRNRFYLDLGEDAAQEWKKWRKWYRVWEVNRKILFFPENWMEPSLRDDKTPIFQDFESEIMQSELTHETAVEALRNYVLKLDEVGSLEMMGLYEEYRPDHQKDIHFIGRTRNLPHRYFYRKCTEYDIYTEEDISLEWTPWEKVDLDIEADHVLPIIYNGRLMLFWPTFREKNDETQAAGKYKDQKEAFKFIELSYNMAEYDKGTWVKRKNDKLKKEIFKDSLPLIPEIKNFTFTFKKTLIAAGTNDYAHVFRIIGPDAIFKETSEIIDPNPIETINIINPVIYPIEGWPTSGTIKADIYFLDKTSGQGIDGLWVHVWVYYADATKNWNKSYKAQNNGFLFTAHEWDDAQKVDFKIIIIPPGYQSSYGLRDYTKVITIDNDRTNYNKISYYLKQIEEKTIKAKTSTIYRKDAVISYGIDKAYLDFDLFHKSKFELTRFPYLMTLNMVSINYLREYQNFIPKNFYHQVRIIGNFWGQGTIDVNTLKNLPSSKPKVLLPIHKNNLAGADFFYPPLCLEGKVGSFFIHKTLLTFLYHEDFITDFLKKIEIRIDRFFTVENQKFLDDNGSAISRNGRNEYAEYVTSWGFMNQLSAPNRKKAIEHLSPLSFVNPNALSQYNWELFYHIPLLVATRLSANQRFEEAARWFEFIFDPTPGRAGGKERFWNCRPLYERAGSVKTLIEELYSDTEDNKVLIEQWRDNPFKPYLIARRRWTAFMKAVVVKYLDNLIAWGDQLFRRETLEAINEATQIYIIAAELLGKRPERVPRVANPVVQSFDTLIFAGQGPVSALSQAISIAEDLAPPFNLPPTYDNLPDPSARAALDGITSSVYTLYFCLPKNDKMLGYWSLVADRLFKIRHCMNIDGIERQLPIFEPPIDPALLVQAAAQGVDISSVLNDLSAPLPIYRFNTLAQKAAEFCNEVRSLGNSLLSALEKRDTEELSRIRADHELKVLQAAKEIRKKQVEEAVENLESLNRSRTMTESRRDYYQNLKFMNEGETAHIALTVASSVIQTVAQIIEAASGPVQMIPDVTVGAAGIFGSPVTISYAAGGGKSSGAMQSVAKSFNIIASLLGTGASLSATLGGYQRRQEEWSHQLNLAKLELRQMEKQITAAQIRQAIAEKEMENHEMQIENTREVNDYIESKFTNKELYDWMITQLAPIYFQSYQLAYDLAKKAEKAFCHELGIKQVKYIQFGYWDGLKKGLLSGDKLLHDLKRMEAAYLEKNKREYELTKQISLAQLNPAALLDLKYKGECFISIPEVVFDLGCAGHYMRRIKSMSITIPCIAGPYTGVHCTLSLMRSSVRHSNLLNDQGEYERKGENDPRFTDYQGAIESIVTSSAQNDSGLFELNLKDERFLPFEGAGVISEWKLKLPKNHRQFNYDTITDVMLHMRYTAREGGQTLAGKAEDMLDNLNRAMTDTGLLKLFSLKYDFPNSFNRMLQSQNTTVPITIEEDHFPYFIPPGKTLKVVELKVVAISDSDATISLKKGAATDSIGKSGNKKTITLAKGIKAGNVDFFNEQLKGEWEIGSDSATVKEILLLFKYQVGT